MLYQAERDAKLAFSLCVKSCCILSLEQDVPATISTEEWNSLRGNSLRQSVHPLRTPHGNPAR